MLKTRVLKSNTVDETLLAWSESVGDKTFRQISEEFAEIIIPKVWEHEGRKVARVAAKLSISPKKVRRALIRAGLQRVKRRGTKRVLGPAVQKLLGYSPDFEQSFDNRSFCSRRYRSSSDKNLWRAAARDRAAARRTAMDVLVGRQPILDKRKRTIAYELLFRSGNPSAGFDGSDGTTATRTVMANTFLTVGSGRVLSNKRGFINFPQEMLINDSAFVLPNDRVVIEILETVTPDEAVLLGCSRLKSRGYTLALDDVVEPAAALPFLHYVDYVKLELPALGVSDRHRVCHYFRDKGISIIAEKVETLEDFRMAADDGCELFQGYFFARPEIVSAKQVPQSKLTSLRLLNEIQRQDLDFEETERIVRMDVGLTRKLLCLVNSAAFAPRFEIDCVSRALYMLGEVNIRKWVALAALPQLASGGAPELVTASLVRAYFCECIGKRCDGAASGYFLTGLLSLLDAMVGRPLDELMREMALDSDIRNAVLGRCKPGDRMRLALEMAVAFERSDFAAIKDLETRTGYPPGVASESYLEAISWADGLPR